MAHFGGFVAGAALIKLFAKPELVARHRYGRWVRKPYYGPW
jgi:membrane associated rhomboid family serine protease